MYVLCVCVCGGGGGGGQLSAHFYSLKGTYVLRHTMNSGECKMTYNL